MPKSGYKPNRKYDKEITSLFNFRKYKKGLETVVQYRHRIIKIFLKAIILQNISSNDIQNLHNENLNLKPLTEEDRNTLLDFFQKQSNDFNINAKWQAFLTHFIPYKNDGLIMSKMTAPSINDIQKLNKASQDQTSRKKINTIRNEVFIFDSEKSKIENPSLTAYLKNNQFGSFAKPATSDQLGIESLSQKMNNQYKLPSLQEADLRQFLGKP